MYLLRAKYICTIVVFLILGNLNAQIYYQDIYQGGVTGDGVAPHNLETPFTINVYIEPGSTIRKAILFANGYLQEGDTPVVREFQFNGTTITLPPSDNIDVNKLDVSIANIQCRVIPLDVTHLVSSTQTAYEIIPPTNQGFGQNGMYSLFYLQVFYENASMPVISSYSYLDTLDADFQRFYAYSNLNPINPSFDVGFTFVGQTFCDNGINDGCYLFVNNNNLGFAGGNEASGEVSCMGVRGSYYYQNQTLYGLGNDTANSSVDGPDVLVNIQPLLTSNNGFDAMLEYAGLSGGNETDNVYQWFNVYTTTCDTFSVSVPSDTSVCLNDELQLNVSGGQSIEWSPSIGLSCTDCYDPIFTADSSVRYTVKIWNNDSCSVVRPVYIKVIEPPVIDDLSIISSDCGTNNGEISITTSASDYAPYEYSIDGGTLQSDFSFTALSAGNHLISVANNQGCVTDSNIVISEQILTTADFMADPITGEVILDISIENTSTNATDYQWYINSNFEGSSLENITFDTSGYYTIELVAWQYDPSCADTSSVTITVIQGLIVPSAFTPDGDNVNDTFEILGIENYPESSVQIFNRWGELIYQSDKGSYQQFPWDGTFNGEELPVASYYYLIELNNEDVKNLSGSVSIIRSE